MTPAIPSDPAPLHITTLGCDGAIAHGARTTAFLVDGHLLVDAGTGVGDLSLGAMTAIRHVVLTHAHLDHMAALPLMLDAVGTRRGEPLAVYALPDTLEALRRHVFNDTIWPDFTRLPSAAAPFVRLHPLALGQPLWLGGVCVEALPALHTVAAVGYALSRGPHSPHWVFSGDTGHHPAFWARVNQLPVAALVIETAFSEREAALAALSRHLCPSSLAQQLAHMRPDMRCDIHITHTKPAESEAIMQEIHALNQHRQASGLPPWAVQRLHAGHCWAL